MLAIEPLLTRAEVKRILKVTDPTLQRLIELEGFPRPCYRITERGHRWKPQDVTEWLESRRAGEPTQ